MRAMSYTKGAPMETSASETRTGGCFCGAVKYVVSGAPINVRACHCQDCQRLTGSAFFVRALFPKAAVTITGQLAEFASSDDLTRKFCPRCGSQLFAERKSRPDTIAIALGSFDRLNGIYPTAHIWISDKQEWLSIPADVQQHPKMPP
ncbi:MAG TPA: GFA family protein [Candidatus Saccharimonadales bacterium]|nr:GFA family protein [Candidatus Saccharimonadales bacterium]